MSPRVNYECPAQEEIIQKVLMYIDKNIAAKISLSALADEAGLSPNYLCFKFKKVIGLNMKEYIIAKRINEAKKKLENNPAVKVLAIALEVGFKDLSHFNHVFKRLTGFTPTAYRKICQSYLK